MLRGLWSVLVVGAQRRQRAQRGAVSRLMVTRGGLRQIVLHRRAAETQRKPTRCQRASWALERSRGWRAEKAESAEGSRSPAHGDAGRITASNPHFLHLSQAQFGLWAGVAIHDISSVVGAGLSYGRESLQTAIAVKSLANAVDRAADPRHCLQAWQEKQTGRRRYFSRQTSEDLSTVVYRLFSPGVAVEQLCPDRFRLGAAPFRNRPLRHDPRPIHIGTSLSVGASGRSVGERWRAD